MQALVIQHLAGEDLGNLKEVLLNRGFEITTIRVWKDNFKNFDPINPDLLVILGGPIGVNNIDTFPILQDEIDFITKRTKNPSLATIGICLGSQMIAHTLGAEVHKGHGAEIGWKKIMTKSNNKYEYFNKLDNHEVLHWHGDTFKIPQGYTLMASSEQYPNQAYVSANHKIMGLQFHLEVKPEDFEGWLITSVGELLDEPEQISKMRHDAKTVGAELQMVAKQFWNEWLNIALLKN